jgi:hypothetical protein
LTPHHAMQPAQLFGPIKYIPLSGRMARTLL